MTIKYTIVRKEIYYLNLRLSDNFFYRKSLQTDSPSKARMIVFKVMNKVKSGKLKLKEDIDKFIEGLITNKLNHVIDLTEAVIDPLSKSYKHYFNAWFKSTDSIRFIIHCSGEDRPIQSYNEFIYTRLDSLSESSLSYRYFHRFSEDEIVPNEDAPFYDDFIHPTIHNEYLNHLENQIKSFVEKIKTNDSRLIRLELDELKSKFSTLLPDLVTKHNKVSHEVEVESTAPYFKDIADEFETYLHQQGASEQNVKESMSNYKEFLPAFDNLRLDDIDSSMLREVWQRVLYTPKMNQALIYGFSLTKEEKQCDDSLSKNEVKLEIQARKFQKRWDVITDEDFELKDSPLDHLFSETSLKARRTILNKIFNLALEKEYISSKPPALESLNTKIKGQIRKRIRTRFPDEEAAKLIKYAVNHREADSRNWVILLMAYHGFRTSEVTTLESANIVIDEDTSIPYINILQGKTISAARKVPIHQSITKLGFTAWVKSKNGRLFDFPAIKMSVYYDKLREELNIPKFDKDRNLLSLYSLRHNVISQLGNASEEWKYRLVGHSVSGSTKIYTTIDLENANGLIQSISYPIKLTN